MTDTDGGNNLDGSMDYEAISDGELDDLLGNGDGDDGHQEEKSKSKYNNLYCYHSFSD